jgi:hypothetical protein
MTSYNELNQEIHRILELTTILEYLFKDRAMCDTSTCGDLLGEYIALVNHHIDYVEKNFYSDLLNNPDKNATKIANNFMSGSVEIKRIIKDFTKQWCANKYCSSLNIKDYSRFLVDSEAFFDLILHRIRNETEHLYPVVRSLKIAS